ncbi:MAG TPA: hypothetical protein V6D09_26320 [Leptolyngbyaceae cyanobacterium]
MNLPVTELFPSQQGDFFCPSLEEMGEESQQSLSLVTPCGHCRPTYK